MTSRTATRRRRPPPPTGRAAREPRWVLGVGATVAFLVVLVLGVALATNDGGDADDEGASTGPVTVEGAPLAAYAQPDPAIGTSAPTVLGRTAADEPIEIGAASAQPTLVVFLAHWCVHCQAEVPVLVRLAEEGAFEGVRVVAVLTGTNPDAPNFPPVAWLEREGWLGEVLLDDEASSAGTAFGEAGYPFLVALDPAGRVVGRLAGEQPAETVTALVGTAMG